MKRVVLWLLAAVLAVLAFAALEVAFVGHRRDPDPVALLVAAVLGFAAYRVGRRVRPLGSRRRGQRPRRR